MKGPARRGIGPGERDDDINASWTANSDAWTRAVRRGRIESRKRATDAAVLACVLTGKPGRVLDVGCGEGWLARALSAHGIDVVGFDAAPSLVEAADRAGGGRFLVLDYRDFAADPALVGDGFDTAVCNFSLFSDEVGGVLRGCRRALSDRGRLIIQTVHPRAPADATPYEDGWRLETFEGIGPGFGASMPWYFRTLTTWVGDLSDAGFVVTAVREPRLPKVGVPASLILVSAPAA